MIADALSRNPVEAPSESIVNDLPMLGITISTDWVAAMQRASKEIMDVRDQLEAGDANAHAKFTMCDARVYRTTKGRWRLYLPEELRYEIVSEAHKRLCHVGIDKTLAAVKEMYYFPRMRQFITSYVNRCINCLYYKSASGKQPGFLHPLDKGTESFSIVHFDHLGPFIRTERDNRYIIAAICGFSKYCMIKAVPDCGSSETLVLF